MQKIFNCKKTITALADEFFYHFRTWLILLLSAFVTVHASELPLNVRFGEVGGTNVVSSGGKPVGAGLVALASHLGYFDEEFGKGGIVIEQIFFAGTGPAQNEALAQGSIDIGTYGGVPNVIGLAGGIPASVIYTSRNRNGGTFYLGIANDSPYQTIKDLKGKRIAVQKGTNPHRSLVLLLVADGLKEKDVTIVNLQGAEALAAFNAGAVDAVFGGVNLLILRDQGKLRVIGKSLEKDDIQSGVLVSHAFEKKHPDIVRRIVKVLLRTSYWASQEEHRENLLQFVSERSFDIKYIREDYAGSLKERYNPLVDESSIKAFQNLVDFSLEYKLIRKKVDEKTIRSWFKPQYQQQGLKQLGLQNYWQ